MTSDLDKTIVKMHVEPDLTDPTVTMMLALGFQMQFQPARHFRQHGRNRQEPARYRFWTTENHVVMDEFMLIGGKNDGDQRFVDNVTWWRNLWTIFPSLTKINPDNAYPHHPGLNRLETLGNVVIELGFPKASTATTLAMYFAAMTFLKADPPFSVAAQWHAFARCAAIANLGNVDIDTKMEYIMRDMSLAAIQDLSARGVPWSLVMDLYPYQTRLREFELPEA